MDSDDLPVKWFLRWHLSLRRAGGGNGVVVSRKAPALRRAERESDRGAPRIRGPGEELSCRGDSVVGNLPFFAAAAAVRAVERVFQARVSRGSRGAAMDGCLWQEQCAIVSQQVHRKSFFHVFTFPFSCTAMPQSPHPVRNCFSTSPQEVIFSRIHLSLLLHCDASITTSRQKRKPCEPPKELRPGENACLPPQTGV